jgi:hypothetical protein
VVDQSLRESGGLLMLQNTCTFLFLELLVVPCLDDWVIGVYLLAFFDGDGATLANLSMHC